MTRLWYGALYYASWLLFGLVSLLLNLCCLPLLPWAGRPGLARCTRSLIRLLFRFWSFWLDASGVVRVRWKGFAGGLPAGRVFIANHPSLVDAPILLARISDAQCILKPAIMRNPALGASARLAAYEPGDNLIDLAHRLAPALRSGRSLLVFPEGTRTQRGTLLGAFKPGFALLASRAAVPVKVVLVRCSEDFVPRGRAWWRLPGVLPCWIEVEEGPELNPADFAGAADFCAAAQACVEAALKAGLVPPAHGQGASPP